MYRCITGITFFLCCINTFAHTQCDTPKKNCVEIHTEKVDRPDCNNNECNRIVASISHDGGTTWLPAHFVEQPTKYDSFLSQLACSDNVMHCSVVGSNTLADNYDTYPLTLYTADQGVNWHVSKLPWKDESASYNGLNFIRCDSQGINCTSVGYWEETKNKSFPLGYYTQDGGKNWNFALTFLPQCDRVELSELDCNNALSLCNVFGIDMYGGFARYQSVDKGKNWIYQSPPNRTGLVACNTSNRTCINIAVSNDRKILSYNSSDAGMSWTPLANPPSPPPASIKVRLNDMSCDEQIKFCAVVGSYESQGAEGIITNTLSYVTTNSGQTWKMSIMPSTESPLYNSLESVSCNIVSGQCAAVGYRTGQSNSDIIPLSYISFNLAFTWLNSATPPPPKNSVSSGQYFDFINSVYCNWGNHTCSESGEYFSASDGKWLPLQYNSNDGGKSWKAT
ncbi:MAG: exo-alpha-sialidase [Gammaproteobacteria bacterium]|nr:exo-alpha-sialidase [Gammaproteobacteria bacterium]